MNHGLNEVYNKTTDSKEWAKALTDAEWMAIWQAAARLGEETFVIIAAMLYTGATPQEAARMRVYEAMGEAVKRGRGYLPIPQVFRRIIAERMKRENLGYDWYITSITGPRAEAAVIAVFEKAGIDTDKAWLRLRRTAACIHYAGFGTKAKDIEACFSELSRIRAYLKEGYYNTGNIGEYAKGEATKDGRSAMALFYGIRRRTAEYNQDLSGIIAALTSGNAETILDTAEAAADMLVRQKMFIEGFV